MTDQSASKAEFDDKEMKFIEMTADQTPTNRKSSTTIIENGYTGSLPSTDLSFQTVETVDDDKTPESKPGWKRRHARIYNICKTVIINAIAIGYFIWATVHYIEESKTCVEPLESNSTVVPDEPVCSMQWCNGYGMFLVLFALTYVGLFYYKLVKPMFGAKIYKTVLLPINRTSRRVFSKPWRKHVGMVLLLIAILAFVIVDSLGSLNRLQSLSGILVLFGIGYVFSAHRSQINFHPVCFGFVFQFLLGVFCIRWDIGRSIFKCLGNKVATFLKYSDIGAAFIYTQELVDKRIFAFTVLPIIFFFSFIISILYYWGAMQWVVQKLGWILQSILGTTVCESVTCSANIFLGMSESPLLIRPYIKHLTSSEIHVIMASGYATVSGSVLAAYISYGADPAHLITSSVMAAPAALGFAKLFYPETEESKTKSGNMVLEKSTDSSVLDAASNGASLAINIVLGITANLIAFVSFVAFLNGLVSYGGMLVGYPEVTFELIFSKLFIPLAWLIGIPWEDCENIAYVIASKTIINEFVAYERLGSLWDRRLISLRSKAIATYAICGFANPSSLGIMIATMSTMAPEKRQVITKVAVRGFVAGSIICFITASIAGLLMSEETFEEGSMRFVNATFIE